MENSFCNMLKILFANIFQSFIKFEIDLLCLKEFTNSRFRSCTCSCMFYKTDEFLQMESDIWNILSLTCLSTCLETFLPFLLFLELIYCANWFYKIVYVNSFSETVNLCSNIYFSQLVKYFSEILSLTCYSTCLEHSHKIS